MAKSKYETHVKPKVRMIEAWARDGLTHEQIARNLRINPDTLYRYKREISELSEALKRGKDDADVEAENALYKRAIGYRYDEVAYETRPDPKTGDLVRVEIKRVTKEALPDVTAQIFWLKNRRPEQWRDRREAPVNERDNGNIEQLTTAILRSAEQTTH